MEVALAHVLALNQPHKFPPLPGGGGGLQLEDGLRAAYAPPHARAKLAEVALALVPIAARLNFAAGGAAAEAAQVEALRAVRGHLDMTSFQRGLDRGREARSLDCTRLVAGGQGHCHMFGRKVCLAYGRPQVWSAD